MMKTFNLVAIVLLFLCVISIVSCQKEESDFQPEETEDSTVVEGTVITSGGLPLAGVQVKVDYNESKWLSYSNIRHKAETTTDKNGKYRLFFSIKDNELKTEKDKESGVNKSYSLIFDMEYLDSEEYIMPGDMITTITSMDPPIGKPAEEVDTKICYSIPFERKKKYTRNLYIPQVRNLQITLKGFIPREGDYFEVCSAFPYGGESVTDFLFPNTNYGYHEVGNYLFVLYDADERTYQVPCALNENNIIKVIRKKNGEYSEEEHHLFVSKNSPDNLIFEY